MRVLLAICLAGCGVDTSAVMMPVGDAAWHTEVASAVAEWQAALGDCSFPYTIGAHGMPVTKFTSNNWPHSKGISGLYVVDAFGGGVSIDVRGGHGALMHEIGHALGLEHNADRTSLMYKDDSGASSPTAADATNAARALGCI